MIKPIETVYNGYRFRSRLEARWAVFFDAMKIKYQYESEGFKIDFCDDESVYYLPDFYLPEFKCYVEVKGCDESLFNDGFKIACAIDFNASPCSEGLLILGDIPNPEEIYKDHIPIFSYLYCRKGIRHEYAAFIYQIIPKLYVGDKIFEGLYSIDGEDYSDVFANQSIPKTTSTECKWLTSETMIWKQDVLKAAYTKARQARFEHGETPII